MRQKFPVLRKRGASRNAHAREKFPGLDAAVIQSKLDIIQQIEGHRLVMDYISPALIAIRAA
jgi:hypothetical protein